MNDVVGWLAATGSGAAAFAGGLLWWPTGTEDRPSSQWWSDATAATVALTLGAAVLLGLVVGGTALYVLVVLAGLSAMAVLCAGWALTRRREEREGLMIDRATGLAARRRPLHPGVAAALTFVLSATLAIGGVSTFEDRIGARFADWPAEEQQQLVTLGAVAILSWVFGAPLVVAAVQAWRRDRHQQRLDAARRRRLDWE